MELKDAVVGVKVKSRVEFAGVPKGTEGVIDQDYGAGVMVAWDLPNRPLPKNYCRFDGKPAVVSGILRDGFDKKNELQLLKRVRY